MESVDLASNEVFQVIEMDGAPLDGEVGPNEVIFLENAKEGKILKADLIDGTELQGIELPKYGTIFNYASSIAILPGLICATDFNTDRLYLIDQSMEDVIAELNTGDGPDSIVVVY